jgi:hypothetical protein
MLCASVLVFEALVVALAIPVAVTLSDVNGATAGWVGGALAVACLVCAGLLRSRLGYALGWALQVLIIACGFVVPAMFALGAVFAAIWWLAIRLGRKAAEAEQARSTAR